MGRKLQNLFYSCQIYALQHYLKQRETYETYILNRKLHKIETQLYDMLAQELIEQPQIEDNSHLQMVHDYMSMHSSPDTTPPNLDMPMFRRERKSEGRLEKLKKKKNALMKKAEVALEDKNEEPESDALDNSDAVTVVSSRTYFEKQTLNFVNTYGDSGGYSKIRQALGIEPKRECNLWGI